MSKRIEIIDEINSSSADPVKLRKLAEYTDTQTSTDFNNNTLPNWGSVLNLVADVPQPPSQQIIPITSNPFLFPSGITGRYPLIRTLLIQAGKAQEYGTPTIDTSNGDIVTTVYTGVTGEDYVLVID